MPPRIIGPYEILSMIGRGGIGTVYRARHQRTGLLAAVKLIGPTPAIEANAARRLAREFEALKDLDHPNVVRVFEAGVAEGYSYLAMELVDGLDLMCYLSPGVHEDVTLDSSEMPTDPGHVPSIFGLEAYAGEPPTGSLLPPDSPSHEGPEAIRAFAELLEEPETDPSGSQWCVRRPAVQCPPGGECARECSRESEPAMTLPPIPVTFAKSLNDARRVERLRDAVGQVIRGLVYVHARGLVHRDLKPSNIMVDDHRRARIMDFGLVKSMDEVQPLTHSGRVVGTYRYMSPEQARGMRVDARSDLFSLGVILYELLCGRPPFLAQQPSDLWHEIVEREAPPILALNPGAEPALAEIAARLMRKDPTERYQTAEQVIGAMEG